MANQAHVDILKQGVAVWNEWREKHPKMRPDLRMIKGASLQLNEMNLFGADLFGADLHGASITNANLNKTTLSQADLRSVNLTNSSLIGADLIRTNLCRATLAYTNLSNSNLTETNFNRANFTETDFNKAEIGFASFADVDLSQAKDLKTMIHRGPSEISVRTIYRSKGNIPEIFLRGAGVPESLIIFMRSLASADNPIDYYTCFISYSSIDQAFAERLYSDLQRKGARCWFAPEDLKVGDKFWHRIDESIKLYDKLLVILSEHSVKSAWVESEVMAALEKEQQHNKAVLFPIKLDEAVMQTNLPWAANIRRTRHIGDFTKWKNHGNYWMAFSRLLTALQSETKEPDTS